MFPRSIRLHSFRLGLIAATALLGAARTAYGENSVAYKFESYREDDGRMTVETHGVRAEQQLTSSLRLELGGVIDTLAGATPSGQPISDGGDQVPLSRMSDRRKAWDVALEGEWGRFQPTAAFAHSRESDYVSEGVSLNTRTAFNEKNTTLLLGVAGAQDRVRVFYRDGWDRKRARDVVVGVTQLLSPRAFATFNVTYGRASGYLSDPYKLVEKNTEVFPGVFLPLTFAENRPDEREKRIVFTSFTYDVARFHGVAEAGYRFYDDTFGIRSHTLEIAWFQRVGAHFVISPTLRIYQQSAADFYLYDLNATSIAPSTDGPMPDGPFYSSDYRLSAMRTHTLGLKLVWSPADWLRVDASYERYVMRGRDGTTPRSAYPSADVVTLGARLSW